MSEINICPKCGLVFKNGYDEQKCTDCGVFTIYSGYEEDDWYSLPRKERDTIKEHIRQNGIAELDEKAKNIAWNRSIMILSSCASVDGYCAVEQLGLVFGECVFKSGFFKRLSASFDNLDALLSAGDQELSGSAKLIDSAREYAIKKMKNEAAHRGANAIIGIDAESSVGDDVIHVTIYGTAVKLEKIQ